MIQPDADLSVRNAAEMMADDWLFKNFTLPLVFVTLSYLYFVLKFGPKYMEYKPPYKLTTFIRYYNILQILTNGWIVYTVLKYGWWIHDLIYTRTVNNSDLKSHLPEFIYVARLIMCIKVIDFVETGIFVLRKKKNQISFLHVYHHVSTVWISWLYAKYFTYELAMPLIVLNCGVHVIMYTYYLFSSSQTTAKLVRSIKPYITIIQMVQFTIMIAYLIQGVIIGNSTVRTLGVISLLNIVINYFLFYNFYRRSYTKVNK